MPSTAEHALLAAILALSGCTSGGGLPAEGAAARDALAGLLADRATVDVAAVSAAASHASAWQGQDAVLDRLLGDALANVLMRPGDGLALLRQRPDPESAAWRAAMGGAALRAGTAAAVYGVQDEAGLSKVDAEAPGVAWLGARALRDPALGWADLVELDADCALLDGQPSRGRRSIDVPMPPALLATARAQGADRVVLGRARLAADDPPETGKGRPPCRSGRLLAPADLQPMPRHVVLVAAGPAAPFSPPLYISLSRGPDGTPWVLASERPEPATALVAAALAAPAAAEP